MAWRSEHSEGEGGGGSGGEGGIEGGGEVRAKGVGGLEVGVMVMVRVCVRVRG